MKIITLTTDFGEKDYSVGAVKGAIYSHIPEARIVDISHKISPFDVMEASYILKNAYIHFPKGSIHIIGVDAELTPERKHLVMLLNGHFFVGTDNGIFHLLSENENDMQVFEIQDVSSESIFPVLEIFPQIIQKISHNIPLEEIGIKVDNYLKIKSLKAEVSANNNFIYGNIIYIDHYGNAVSNITHSLFENVRKGRKFEVIFKSYSFKKLSKRYTDVVNFKVPVRDRLPDGNPLILFNSVDFLQVSIFKSDLKNMGGASTLLGIEPSDSVTVQFFD